jgi:hypothetical protein
LRELIPERALQRAKKPSGRVGVFCTRRTRTTRYASQHAHSREPMCTSVSLHWVMTCHITGMLPECSAAQMRLIMQQGLRTHRAVQGANADGRAHGMLHAHEVLEHSPLPPRYAHRELHGCVGCALPEEVKDYCVQLQDLRHLLTAPRSVTGQPVALLFTATGHTTALFACKHGLFHFDSLVAQVEQIEFDDVMCVLLRTHKLSTDHEYSVVVVT